MSTNILNFLTINFEEIICFKDQKFKLKFVTILRLNIKLNTIEQLIIIFINENHNIR